MGKALRQIQKPASDQAIINLSLLKNGKETEIPQDRQTAAKIIGLFSEADDDMRESDYKEFWGNSVQMVNKIIKSWKMPFVQ